MSIACQPAVVLGCVGSLHGAKHCPKSQNYSTFYETCKLVSFMFVVDSVVLVAFTHIDQVAVCQPWFIPRLVVC